MHWSGSILELQLTSEKTSADEPAAPAFSTAAPQAATAPKLQSQEVDAASDASAEISVLVSDSTEIGGELLSSALRSANCGFRIVKSAVSSWELLDATNTFEPDVALVSMELREGRTAGLHALKALRTKVPATRCILLMDHASRDFMIEALRAGARGVFLRDSPLQMLWRCIRAVRKGEIWLSNTDMCHVIELFVAAAVPTWRATGEQDVLSKREKEITMLVTQGYPNREIARQMHISEHTVKNYLQRIFDKVGVSSRAELIVRFLTEQNAQR